MRYAMHLAVGDFIALHLELAFCDLHSTLHIALP